MRAFRVILVILIIISIGFGLYKLCSIAYSNPEIIEIEVKDKFIKKTGDEDYYMIVDTENNTYQISDLLFIGKFNSTDIYNQLEIGHKYKVEVTGIRNNFWSFYKNINKIIEEE